MNEEEKKAIEKFKFCGGNFVLDKESSKVVLNLIEKLQKENEELKENDNKYTIHLTDEQYNKVIEIVQNDIKQKWIQKVKDKIEELKKEGNYRTIDNPYGRVHFMAEGCDYKIQVLQELIEEREEK